jgi:hypothetical protein
MSIELLLIPLGIAAIAAIREASSSSLCEKCKATSITDQGLLVEALVALGITQISQGQGRITGRTTTGTFTFQSMGNAFLGRLDGDEAGTPAFLAEVQAAAGRVSQLRSFEAVKTQAAAMGLVIVSQQMEDGNIQLVLEHTS